MKYSYQHGDRPLDGYTVLRGLGRGGFGEVYYARSDGGREVALKVIQQNHDIELRGVRQCMNLKSPHLVTIFDVKLNEKDVPFVIMEYVGGSSIRDIAQENPKGLGRAQASYLIREIARGLDYLHEAGIVHRDLKPENIFFENGMVKIGDYGLSKYINVSRHSGQTMSVGTVQYMAPEIGSGSYTKGIDVYALGIIFYELLTGNVPFDGDSMGEILMKHLSVEPDLTPIDPLLRPILEKALAKKPEHRYADAREMVNALEKIPEIANELGKVRPASICSQAPSSAGTPVVGPIPPPLPQEQLVTAEAAPERYESPPPRGLAGSDQPDVAENGDELPQPRASAWEGQVVLAGCAAGAMAIATALLQQGTWSLVALHFLSLIFGAGSICYAHRRLLPSLGIESGIASRLITLCVAAVPLGILNALLPGRPQFLLVPLLMGVGLLNWRARVHPDRRVRFSLEQALLAGLLGGFLYFVCTMSRLPVGNPFTIAGTLAGLSLVSNALAPYGKRRRRRPGGPPPERRATTDENPYKLPDKTNARAQEAAPTSFAPPPQGDASQQDNAFQPTPDLNNPSGQQGQLVRPRSGGMLCGVAAGVARYLNWEVVWVRLLFIIGIFFSGITILVYFVLYFLMPEENWYTVPRPSPSVQGLFSRLGRGIRGLFTFSLETVLWGGGLLLIALAGAAALLGTLWSGGFGAELIRDVGLPRGDTLEFCASGFHLLLATALFATGVFLTLLGRRSGGPWHVLRGATAWLGMGIIAGGLAFQLGDAIAVTPESTRTFDVVEWFRRDVLGSHVELKTMALFLGAMAFVLLLAWPRTRQRSLGPYAQASVRETTEPFKRDNPAGGVRWALIVSTVLIVLIGLFVSLAVLV